MPSLPNIHWFFFSIENECVNIIKEILNFTQLHSIYFAGNPNDLNLFQEYKPINTLSLNKLQSAASWKNDSLMIFSQQILSDDAYSYTFFLSYMILISDL